jgi:hypothetical protein
MDDAQERVADRSDKSNTSGKVRADRPPLTRKKNIRRRPHPALKVSWHIADKWLGQMLLGIARSL